MNHDIFMSRLIRTAGLVVKWLFVGTMCIFTLYPVIYAVIGSFKTNAELTPGRQFPSCRVAVPKLCVCVSEAGFWKVHCQQRDAGPSDRPVQCRNGFYGGIRYGEKDISGKTGA